MNNGYDPYPEALDEAVLSRAAKFGSAELADGMKGLGIKNDGCMDAAILPIDENTRVLVLKPYGKDYEDICDAVL